MRGGVDEGPCFSYWRLSYRRKFIRTCWTQAAGILLLAFMLVAGFVRLGAELMGMPWEDRWGWWFLGACVVGAVPQAVYTYFRWQHEANSIAGLRTRSTLS